MNKGLNLANIIITYVLRKDIFEAQMKKHREEKSITLALALRELLKHDPIEKITVDQICREAAVHRSTFYRYFQDKYDLLNYAFDKIWLEKIDEDDIVDSIILLIFKEKDIFRNISINNNNNLLYWIMVEMVTEKILVASQNDRLHNIKWIEETVLQATDPKLAANMVAGAFLTLLFEWVDSNYQMDPKELSDFVRHLH